ncbi:hypothetical protein [Providencia burhodogranariea]|uniref:Uncharacterized protein n=1 Tax=Providencia burhodogranariea DSM 19968 TaxID=1141662 RepID=K8X141_9GAMM|nr:hypothetical protein [Providencia burhodogranariea]EKT62195.1 hypothetical protein OOA_08102 [Providencia burhodogranariea DSM 19968]
MRKVIPFFLTFIAANSWAVDFRLNEKPPVDRYYNENYQGIDKIHESKRFIFDPNKEIPDEDLSYAGLLARKQDKSRKQEEWNNWYKEKCESGVFKTGCSGQPTFLYGAEKMKEILEQSSK